VSGTGRPGGVVEIYDLGKGAGPKPGRCRSAARLVARLGVMNKPPTRRTTRLLLRALEPVDIDPLYEIQSDPEAMKFTYCSPSREATATRLEEYAVRFAEDGFAPWTVILASEDRIIGWGGLNKDPAEPEWGARGRLLPRSGLLGSRARHGARARVARLRLRRSQPSRCRRLHQAGKRRIGSRSAQERLRADPLRSRAGARRVPNLPGRLVEA